jgi:hypothetical protein
MDKASRYHTHWLAVTELTPADRQRMAELYFSCYDGSDPALFGSDLDSKDGVLLLYADNQVVGFTTLAIYSRNWQGRSITVVFSGDTVVARAHWGQQTLALEWIALMGRFRRQHPERPMYWLLLVKGHRTFLYLPVFGRSFWPHWQQDRSDLKPLADFLAGERFPDHYNPDTGVIEFPVSRGHLKPELAEPDDHQRQRPEVEFFVRKNPGFGQGHELVCLCEIEEPNMRPLARRLFLRDRDSAP